MGRAYSNAGLTGTVIQNSYDELWTLVNFVWPGYLNTLDHFRRSKIHPIMNGQRHDAQPEVVARGRRAAKDVRKKNFTNFYLLTCDLLKLSLVLQKVILRRTKSVIAADLPGKEGLNHSKSASWY